MAELKLNVERLQTGVFVKLPVKWGEHPFMFTSFKIKSQDQIDVIKNLGLKHVIVVPEKSDTPPLPANQEQDDEKKDDAKALEKAAKALWEEKRARIEELKNYRRNLQKVEKEFDRSMAQVRAVMSKLKSRPLNAVDDATTLINNLADDLLSGEGVVLHLMNDSKDADSFYYHSLNVSILAMMLAKAAGFSERDIKILGLAGLFHDVGKMKIPDKVLRKPGKLTAQEANLLKMHTKYGADFLKLSETIPAKVKVIAAQHHEYLDGSGYPQKLKGDSIDRLAQLIAVVNEYDSLCHPRDPRLTRIPFTVISYLYKQRKAQLNAADLGILIRLLGIYPPGSVVQLSSGQIGLVMSVNSERLLFPAVQVYDPNIPRTEAPIIDLEAAGLTIEKALKPSALPDAVFEYLNPRARISYYFDHNKRL
ncbi:HD-GYP domain-containing protein [Agarivorans sp. 1_MG-2023]|uniref:HD-GYP domain-containing protein n=1 Tax=Agarivorans sp. 1_MG-2023 TaxID=3062634 RepID=UPI0026E42937|nr:HD-GYP domain-containing protein [Agarivorans sp. 1_MG-2023]MDO6765544.1 HD-GYP domain-containing protein [Agarivorans sp. 1_MG-2023]